MPDIIAHCWYGDLISTRIQNDRLRNAIRKHRKVFMLGCQGPDPFIAYNRLPLQHRSNVEIVRNCAELLHDDKINESFRALIDVVNGDDDLSVAYLAGYFCHWALDKTVHPYVFYETGSLNEKAGNKHALFEMQIDSQLLKDNKIDTGYYCPKKLLKVNGREKKAIAQLLKSVLESTYGVNISEATVANSITDFINVYRLLWDPDHKKHSFISRLDSMMGLNGLAVSMMLPEKYDDEMDAMNFAKRKWHNPADENISSDESFYELGVKTVTTGVELLELYGSFLEGKADCQVLLNYINDESFYTGIDYRRKMKYFRENETAN